MTHVCMSSFWSPTHATAWTLEQKIAPSPQTYILTIFIKDPRRREESDNLITVFCLTI